MHLSKFTDSQNVQCATQKESPSLRSYIYASSYGTLNIAFLITVKIEKIRQRFKLKHSTVGDLEQGRTKLVLILCKLMFL